MIREAAFRIAGLEARIAQLEAELAADGRAEAAWERTVEGLKARAEKAEAEVERLTADLQTALKVIRQGGGRESGGRNGVATETEPSNLVSGLGAADTPDIARRKPAVANPAARKERDDG